MQLNTISLPGSWTMKITEWLPLLSEFLVSCLCHAHLYCSLFICQHRYGTFTVVELHRCMLALRIRNRKPGFDARCMCCYSSGRFILYCQFLNSYDEARVRMWVETKHIWDSFPVHLTTTIQWKPSSGYQAIWLHEGFSLQLWSAFVMNPSLRVVGVLWL